MGDTSRGCRCGYIRFAEMEEAVEGAAIVAGRRWMTVFTVTPLVVPGGKGREASGSFGRTQKVFSSGIGGMIREWYMVFWKRDLGWGVVEDPVPASSRRFASASRRNCGEDER